MINILLVGAGSVGQIHAANLVDHPGVNFFGIADIDAQRAEALAARHAVRALPAAEKIDPGVDAVIIASSTAAHAEAVRACLGGGHHLLCEKPLSRDIAETRTLVSQAASANLVCAVGFDRRFAPEYIDLREAVRRGEIGKPEMLSFISRSEAPPSPDFLLSSGGLFGEKGSHFYDLTRWITDENPSEVFAMGSVLVNPAYRQVHEVDTAAILMRLPSGALVKFDFSWRAAYGQDERLEVFGSRGMVQMLQPLAGHTVLTDGRGRHQDGPVPSWRTRFLTSYAAELDAFVAAIKGDKQPQLATLADGLAAQQLADAVARSVQENRPISITPG